ncbi:hypothetical protein MSIMFB_00001 [Mycobacterium simulans]|uniref:Uncharacterized protein n=1 Tax=Mycobacterium simulans TaxID=627089 RepID=A0A7Z7IH76_9MYCO|nr:hypothetical protein MSIMFB_00001 [Mycobacterium simulans]
MGPTLMPAPMSNGMRSIVIAGVVNPSICPTMSMVNGIGSPGILKPGIVNPGVPTDNLASNSSAALGTVTPSGNRVIAGVSQFMFMVSGGKLVLISMGPIIWAVAPLAMVTIAGIRIIPVCPMLVPKFPAGIVKLSGPHFCPGKSLMGERVIGPTLIDRGVPPPNAGMTMSGTTRGGM